MYDFANIYISTFTFLVFLKLNGFQYFYESTI